MTPLGLLRFTFSRDASQCGEAEEVNVRDVTGVLREAPKSGAQENDNGRGPDPSGDTVKLHVAPLNGDIAYVSARSAISEACRGVQSN